MKLNRLDTHDRLLHFKKDQDLNIFQGAEECLKKNPDALKYQAHSSYIYIFAHPRTAEDGINKRLLWQPRLIRPKPESNSYLFRAQSHTDLLEVCWLIPDERLWPQFEANKLTAEPTITWSIEMYCLNRDEIAKPHPEDLSIAKAGQILKTVLLESIAEKNREKLLDRHFKQVI
jgi:hypothetical protein